MNIYQRIFLVIAAIVVVCMILTGSWGFSAHARGESSYVIYHSIGTFARMLATVIPIILIFYALKDIRPKDKK